MVNLLLQEHHQGALGLFVFLLTIPNVLLGCLLLMVTNGYLPFQRSDVVEDI